MFETLYETLTGPDWWAYVLIPFINAIVGWGTNVVAIRMTFYPVEFWGIPPYLGWQGIIPRKALKMAKISVDIMVPRLISMEEVFDRVDPERVAEEMEPAFDDLVKPAIRDVMKEESPTLWETLPGRVKDEVFRRFRNDFPHLVSRILDVRTPTDQREPEEFASDLKQAIEGSLEPLISNTLAKQSPTIWESLPEQVKTEVFREAKDDMPNVISNMFEEWKDRIQDIFDLRYMILEELKQNKQLLNDIFLRCGEKEFRFIERSGLYFGFLFGLVQMIVWVYWQHPLILPIAGFFVGFATNWMALKLIFSPQEPINFGLFELHGMFFKRQNEVADEYGELVANKILYPDNILDYIFHGTKTATLFQIMQKHIHVSMDRVGGLFNPVIRRIIGPEEYFQMKNKMTEKFMNNLQDAVSHAYDYLEHSLDIGNTLSNKLKSLEPEEFEGILRPAFQEDEWLLIAVGAVLGFIAGILQFIFLFGGALTEIGFLTYIPFL